ncbi:hypothetical protein [uncultured Mailhella sp.]|uniref:DUF4376 domain-containing protein n=1 Tax=uncultured Mailhella sp. TaxID=1981031 RepID=UPI00320BA82F
MYKYAEIYGGLVRDLKESNLGYTEFCSIFDPSSYWLDVTGVEDIDIGYVIKFTPELGTYFEAPEPKVVEETLETKRAKSLELLKARFAEAADKAWVDSSLGFRANANETAYRDVDGLILLLEGQDTKLIQFCDYDNLMQALTLDKLKVLQKEIAQNGTYLYQQKWDYRDTIEGAETMEELDTLSFSFKNMSFMPADDNGQNAVAEGPVHSVS